MPVALTEIETPEQNANSQQALKEALALVRKYQTVPPVAESGTPEQNVNFAGAIADLQGLAAKYKLDIGEYAARPLQSPEQAQRKAALLAETAALRSQPDPTWLTGWRQANAEVTGDVARGVAQVPVGMLKFAGTVADTTRRWFPDASQIGETSLGGSQSALTTLGEFIESQANRLPGGDPDALSSQFNRGIGQLGGMLTPAAIAQTAAKRLATGAALKAGAASEAAVLAGAKAGRNYGTATAVTAGFGQEFDDAFQRSRRLGDDPDTALFKALGYGTVAAGIEQFAGAGRLFRKFFPSPDEAIKALTTWNVSKEIVKNFVAGYAEEAAQRIAQNVIVEPGSDFLAGAHEEGRVGSLVQGLVGLPGAARGMRTGSSQPPPLPAQSNPDLDLVQLYDRAVTERRRLILTGTPHTDPRILQIDRLTEDLTQQMRDKTAASKPVKENPTAPIKPSVAPADLLGRTFAYNEQGTIARIVGATSQGVEIETPEGKANVSYAQWQTTPQDVFDRTKTQTELPYAAAIAKPAMVKIVAPKISTPPVGTVSSQPAAEPVTVAAPIAGVQLATPSQESEQTKSGVTVAQIPVAGGVVPIGSFVATGKDSTGTWRDETVTVLSIGEPVKQRRASSDGGWRVSFEVPSTLGKTGRQTRTKNFFKKANALAWIADVKQSKPGQTISNAPTERTPDEVLTKTDMAAPVAGVPLQPSRKPVIFTDEAAAKAKAELRAMLGRTNALVDPTMLAKVVVIAGNVIERGAIRFNDYVREMLAELGEAVRPYFATAYNQVRDYTEAHTIKQQMTSREEVESYENQNEDTEVQRTDPTGTGREPKLPGAVRGSSGQRRPGLRVVDEGDLPEVRPIVRAGQYKGANGHAIDETQRSGANRILTAFKNEQRAFVLSDGTGTGKTGTELVVASEMARIFQKPSLIVTLSRAIIENRFKEDAKKFGIQIDGQNIEIVTYDDLSRGQVPERDFGVVIFDEANALKNVHSARSQASRRIKSDHVVFATATAMDSPTHAAYFLAEITGQTQQQIANALGYRLTERMVNGELVPKAILKQGIQWVDVIDALKRLRNKAVKSGQLIRREFPFFGTAQFRESKLLTPDQLDSQALIEAYWDAIIDRMPPGSQARANYSGQKTNELSRWLEIQKLPEVLDEILSDLAANRRVVVFATGVHRTLIKGLGVKVPGFLDALSEALDKRGIKHASVFGSNGPKKAKEARSFQRGEVQILLATAKSGGAGLDMDDIIGNAPRSAHFVTMDFSAEVFDQQMGRVSRRNTASPARVQIWRQRQGYADKRRENVLNRKLSVLRNIQTGEDLDTSAFTTAGDIEEADAAPFVPTAPEPIKPRTPYVRAERPPDVIDDLEAVGTIDLDAARKLVEVIEPTGAARAVFRKGGLAPDDALMQLHRAGKHLDITSDDQLVEAILSAPDQRSAYIENKAKERRQLDQAAEESLQLKEPPSEIVFSQRADPVESGLTVEGAQESMRPMLADFPEAGRPQIVVAPARDWPADTQALIQDGKIVNGATHRRTVNGKTVTTIYIDPEQIGSDEELRQVLAEELVGHSGMAALLSESEIGRLYELLNRSRPERVAELSKDVGVSGDTITGQRAIVDEFLGESARTLPRNDPLWRQLFDAIVNALRRLNLLPASLDETKLDAWVRQLGRQANRRLRSGRYNVDDKVILPEIAFSVKTLMHGVPQEVGGTQAPEYDRPAGLEETVRRFNRSGLPVVRTGRTHGYVRLLDEGPPATTQLALQMDKAGRLLVEEFKNVPQEARELGQPGAPPNDRLGSFVDAGRFMAKRMLDEHDAGRGAAFSREILEEIFSYTQDEASERGRNLASLNQQEPKNVLTRGKYMGVELRQDLRTRFDPNGQIADVLKVFRDRFTSLLGLTKDDAGLLASLETFLNDLLARQPVQNASKLYRWVHQALKPQFAKSMNALEQDSFLREAVRQLIANANLFGHETPERKTKPLTALAQLLLKANPSAVAKMDAMIANAVRTGELKAARAWLVEQGASEDELADFDDGIRVPTPAEIEAGLALPEHKHWKVIRDNLLGYSPVTDALVGKVLRGDFKGIKPKPGAPKPAASPKIDLIALAKEPDVEVQRVFDEYAKNIQDMLDLNGAMPWMQTRIVMQIRKQLADQLAGQREAIRNRFFTPRKERTESDTPSERFQALVNAGLLDDERMLNGMLTEAARKSTVTKLLPSMADMVEMVLSTPLSRRTEAAERFAALLAEQFQLIPEQEDQARKLFTTAFEEKFKRAEAKAREEAFEKLTPEQKEEAKKKPSRSLWKHVQRVLNTGLFTDMAVYAEFNNRGIALSEADIAKVSGLVEKAEALTRPTAEQIAAANGDQAKLDAAARENEALHYGDIKALERRITALWTRNFKPLSLIGLFTSSQVRENATRAFFDHITANILFTINFVARNPIDVWFSTQLHRVTNARGHAFEQLNLLQEQAVREGKPAPSRAQMLDLWGENFLNGISIRYKTRKEKYTRYREAWAKRGLPSRIEGMTSTMATFERTEELLSELWAKGEAWSPKLALSRAKSIALAIVTVDRFAFRFAGTLDVLQATPIGWQEFRSLLTTELIRLGLSKAERITWEEAIIGQIDTDLQGAARDAAAKFSAEGITPSRSQLNAGAWQLVFARMAERAYELGTEDRRVNMEAIKERISELQQYSGWNLPEGGLGGFFRKGSEIGQEALIALRLPIPLALFGNALAMAANRGLNFTGLPFYAQLLAKGVNLGLKPFGVELPEKSFSPYQFSTPSIPESPGAKYLSNQGQRQAEAEIGAFIGPMVAYAVLTGLFHWYGKEPEDELERAERRRRGILPQSLGIPLPGTNRELPIPLMVAPGSFVAAWAAFAGALVARHDRKKEAHGKLVAESVERGLAPPPSIGGPIAEADAKDYAVATIVGLGTSVAGGRTATGKLNPLADYRQLIRDPDSVFKRMIVQQASPIVTGLPAYQKLAWASGVNIDVKTASVLELAVPLPWSGARKVNALGENVEDPRFWNHFIAATTGGFGVTAEETEQAHANFVLAGYHPPMPPLQQAYDFKGQYRPMTTAEYQTYVQRTGAGFKRNLTELGDISGMPDDQRWSAAQRAYHSAQRQTIEEMGFTPKPERQPSGGSARPKPAPVVNRPRAAALPRSSRFGSRGFSVRVPSFAPTKLKRGRRSRSSRRLFASVPRSRRVKLSRVRSRTKSRRRLFSV